MLQLKALYNVILSPELVDDDLQPPPSAGSGHTPTLSKKEKGKQTAAGKKEKEKRAGSAQGKQAKDEGMYYIVHSQRMVHLLHDLCYMQ